MNSIEISMKQIHIIPAHLNAQLFRHPCAMVSKASRFLFLSQITLTGRTWRTRGSHQICKLTPTRRTNVEYYMCTRSVRHFRFETVHECKRRRRRRRRIRNPSDRNALIFALRACAHGSAVRYCSSLSHPRDLQAPTRACTSMSSTHFPLLFSVSNTPSHPASVALGAKLLIYSMRIIFHTHTHTRTRVVSLTRAHIPRAYVYFI